MTNFARYQSFAQDALGNAIISPTVEVRRESDGTIVPLYSDRTGVTPVGNPFVGGGDGLIAFHVAGGAYKITITKSGFSRVLRYVAIGTYSELDIDTTLYINVDDFGAVGNGTTDDTVAIQAAITAAGANAKVLLGNRTYKITSTLTITASNFALEGTSPGGSRLLFVPTADDVAIAIGNGASTVNYVQLRNFELWSTDTTYTKTAIDVSDIHFFIMDGVTIGGSDTGVGGTNSWGGGTGSIGVHLHGRDFIKLLPTSTVAAEKPVVISTNPNYPIEFDHSECLAYLIADGYPCIRVDDGVYQSNSTYSGAWAGGTHGYYCSDTTSGTTSHGIKFQNIRVEQGQDATAYSIYFDGNGACNGFSIVNTYLDINKRGIYLRSIRFGSIRDVIYPDTVKEAFNIDSTVSELVIENCFWQAGSTATITGQNIVSAGPDVPTGSPLPGTVHYSTLGGADFNSDIITVNTRIVPDANDGAAIGTSALSWSDLFLASGGVINWAASDYTITHSSGRLAFATTNTDIILALTNSSAGAIGAGIGLMHDSASPAASDAVGYISFSGRDSAANVDIYGQITCTITDPTSTSEDSTLAFRTLTGGASTMLVFGNNVFYPGTNDAAALGAASVAWSDLFLASGGVINFNNGDLTLTHSANTLAIAGGTVTFDTAPTPAATDGAALGTTSAMWSDLFLATGGVINWNNSTVTFAESSGTLVMTTATSNGGIRLENTNADPNGTHLVLYANSASPANSDVVGSVRFRANNSAAAAVDYSYIQAIITDVTSTSEDSQLNFVVQAAGAIRTLSLSGPSAALFPNGSSMALGASAAQWADLFLESGGVINFNAGDVTITHSANTLAFAGASTAYTFDAPITNTSTAAILTGTAIPAGGTAGSGYKFSSTSNFGVFFGSGAPTLSAAKGSIYLRSDGSSTSTRMYVNTDGATTWTSVTTAA